MRRWAWIAIVAVVALAATFYLRGRGPAPTAVDIERVTERARFQSFATASGEIVAARYADLGSSVMGRLVELRVKEGDRVEVGQVLARIDPAQAASAAEAVAALARALESDLAAARAREAEAARVVARARNLHEQGIAPQADLDTAEAAAETTRAAVAAAEKRAAQGRAQLAGARDSLAKTEITAPLAGVVSRLAVREGEMVVIGVQNQPGTILLTISDLSQIDAEVKVAEADVLRLAPGQRAYVSLEALGGREFEGKVVEIGASALPVVGSGAAAREFRVVVRLDRPDPGLRPGLTCDVRVLTEEVERALVVPLQALVLRRGVDGVERPGVFVVENRRARFQPVEQGVIGGLEVEVRGLAAGTEIVAGPFQALRDLADGAPLRPL